MAAGGSIMRFQAHLNECLQWLLSAQGPDVGFMITLIDEQKSVAGIYILIPGSASYWSVWSFHMVDSDLCDTRHLESPSYSHPSFLRQLHSDSSTSPLPFAIILSSLKPFLFSFFTSMLLQFYTLHLFHF